MLHDKLDSLLASKISTPQTCTPSTPICLYVSFDTALGRPQVGSLLGQGKAIDEHGKVINVTKLTNLSTLKVCLKLDLSLSNKYVGPRQCLKEGLLFSTLLKRRKNLN